MIKVTMQSGESDIVYNDESTQFESFGKNIAECLRHVAKLDVNCFVTNNGYIYVLEAKSEISLIVNQHTRILQLGRIKLEVVKN